MTAISQNALKSKVIAQIAHDCVGCFAYSAAGRDRLRCFVIISADIESGRVTIADGQLRKLEKPKNKNIKHLKIDTHRNAELVSLLEAGLLTDKKLRGFISEYEGRARVSAENENL